MKTVGAAYRSAAYIVGLHQPFATAAFIVVMCGFAGNVVWTALDAEAAAGAFQTHLSAVLIIALTAASAKIGDSGRPHAKLILLAAAAALIVESQITPLAFDASFTELAGMATGVRFSGRFGIDAAALYAMIVAAIALYDIRRDIGLAAAGAALFLVIQQTILMSFDLRVAGSGMGAFSLGALLLLSLSTLAMYSRNPFLIQFLMNDHIGMVARLLLVGSVAVPWLIGLAFFGHWTDVDTLWAATLGICSMTAAMLAMSVGVALLLRRAERLREDLIYRSRLFGKDEATGLPNRRALPDFIRTLESRTAETYALILARIGSEAEHAGPAPIECPEKRALTSAYAGVVTRFAGASGHVFRWSDNAFLIVGEVDDKDSAHAFCDSLRQAILDERSRAPSIDPVQVSFGIVIVDRDTLLHGGEDALRLTEATLAEAEDDTTGDGIAVRVSQRGAKGPDASALARDVADRNILATEFMVSLAGGDVIPHYQPIIDLHDGSVWGFEALARWRHPDHGLLSAAAFSSLLSDRRIVTDLTFAMLRRSIEELSLIETPDRFRLSLNITAHDLIEPDFVEALDETIREKGWSWRRMLFEITENVALDAPETQIRETLGALRQRGALVALDDFGVGYGTLRHLRDWPLDVIKIDKSFVSDLLTDTRKSSIVGSTIELARSMDMLVIAEGVETPAQSDALASRWGICAQGYYYGKPADLKAARALLRRTSLVAA